MKREKEKEMEKKKVIEKVVDYFRSDHWQNFLNLLNDPPEEVYHAHFWMENAIEAHSLVKLMDRYLKKIGWEVDRKIDLMSGPGGPAGLHCVHPNGGRDRWTLTFDMFWYFNAESILAPSPPERGEMGKSFVWWGKTYMEDFLKKFQFRPVGKKEEKEIEGYFQSKHFKELLRHIPDFSITHMHANFEINFDPYIFKLYMRESLKEVGFRVQWTLPCVFHVPEGYRGKIVFLMTYPEVVWDIAWKFNPAVTIKPSEEVFIFDTNHPGFDMSKDSYIKLDDEEINDIIQRVLK